jgi:group I intron endonuclease
LSAGIYRITNLVTNEVYVGYSVDLKKRLSNYKHNTVKSQPLIHESIKKYGFENHVFHVLFKFGEFFPTTYQLKELESVYIRYYKYWKECNMLNSNEGGGGCRKWSDEEKTRKSENRKGFSKRGVLQYDFDGKFIRKWASITKVSKELELDYNLLIRCLKGNDDSRSVGGFQWRYDNKNQNDVYDNYKDIEPYVMHTSAKPLLQYDLDGNFIREWSSAIEVNENIGIRLREIYESANNRSNKVFTRVKQNFQWRYKVNGNFPKKISLVPLPVIIQYTLEGHFIKIWYSISDISSELKIPKKTLIGCLNNRQKKSGGFQWKRARNDNYNTDPIESLIKDKPPESNVKLLQYSMDGKFIRAWEYPTIASRELRIDASSISSNIKGYLKSAGKYRWQYGDIKNIVDLPSLRVIVQYTKEGELVKEWGSAKEIVNSMGFSQGNISNCITGRIEQAYGYVWRYK